MNNLVQNFAQPDVLNRLAIPINNGVELIDTEDILRVSSQDSRTQIVYTNGKSKWISKTLSELEDALDQRVFARVHRSHIVNLKFIKKYIRTAGNYVIMQDESVVEVARINR